MSSGFIPPTYEAIRNGVIGFWKAAYGPNADTSSDTVDGLILDLQALGGQKILDALGECYNQSKFGTATDLNIDALLEIFGTLRKQATPSTCEVWLYGTNGTIVPAISGIATIDTGVAFATDNVVTIADGVFNVFTFVALAIPTLITVVIGGETTLTTTDGTAEDVRNAVALQLLGNTKVATLYTIGVQPDGKAILLVQKTSTWTATIAGSGSVYPATIGFASASVTGPQNAAAGTITRITSALAGWVGVVNVIDATVGTRTQTDAQYKAGHVTALQSKGFATPRGLAGQLLALAGVTAVRIYMNTTNAVVAGRPSHSFEAVVLGGDQFAIAETIWLNHTTGTQSFGSTTIVVTDDQGLVPQPRDIMFSRPTSRYAWARIGIKKGEGFPLLPLTDVQSLISQVLETWGNGLGIGGDIYVVQVSGQVNGSLAGVAELSIEIATTPTTVGPPSYGFTNITIGETQLSVWSATRVEVYYYL